MPIPGRAPTAGKPPRPSALGGPSGPGGNAMLQPGTGAGSQAMALGKIDGVMDTLSSMLDAFPGGSEEVTAILGAMKLLNNLQRKKSQPKPVPAPPIPATRPGSSLGGLSGPHPTGGGEMPGVGPPPVEGM